jgi:hypothetical protein
MRSNQLFDPGASVLPCASRTHSARAGDLYVRAHKPMATSSAPKKKASSAGEASAVRRVAAYEKQFYALEAQVFKLEAESARFRARIKVLEQAKPGVAIQTMTDAELEAQLVPLIEQLGYLRTVRRSDFQTSDL